MRGRACADVHTLTALQLHRLCYGLRAGKSLWLILRGKSWRTRCEIRETREKLSIMERRMRPWHWKKEDAAEEEEIRG